MNVKRKLLICSALICLLLFCSIPVLAVETETLEGLLPSQPETGDVKKEYTVSISTTPSDFGSVDILLGEKIVLDQSVTVSEGAEITLVARPKQGYVLKEWVSKNVDFELPDDQLSSSEITLSVQGNIALEAVFEKEVLYSLTIERDDISGESYIVSEKNTFRAGETVRVDATPYDGYAFVEWNESCTTFDFSDDQKVNSKLEFIMPAEDVVLTMKFKPIVYYFTVEVQGTGEVEVLEKELNAAGKYECTVGEEIAISAVAGEEFTFVSWTGVNGAEFSAFDQEETTLTCPAADFTVTANFASSVMELTITSGEGGSVSPQEGTFRMGVENVFNMTAVPDEGYVFAGWECSSDKGKFSSPKEQSTAFVMPDENCTVTATFQKGGYTLKLTASAGGTVEGETGKYEMGEKVSAQAKPMKGYEFSRWECSVRGAVLYPDMAKTEIVMPGSNLEVTAIFALKTSAQPTVTSRPSAEGKDTFPWVGLVLVFVLSAIAITLVIVREKYNLSYRYLLRRWLKKDETDE